MQSVKNIEEQELIVLCRKGKGECFTELYLRYCKAVYNAIFRIVPDKRDAEDLLQEVFATIYGKIMEGYEVEYFGGWSKRIAINRALNFLRQRKILFVDLEDEYEQNIPERENGGAGELFDVRVEEVKSAIAHLSGTEKMIVNLYLLEDIPQEEIAQMLGISHGAVRTQYHRAKTKIRALLPKEKTI